MCLFEHRPLLLLNCLFLLLLQVDLRPKNSWRLPLEDVSTPEASEVMAVNALAPFVLNSRLVPLMRVRVRSSSRSPSHMSIAADKAASTPSSERRGGDEGGDFDSSSSSSSSSDSSRRARPCPRFIVNVSAMEGMLMYMRLLLLVLCLSEVTMVFEKRIIAL